MARRRYGKIIAATMTAPQATSSASIRVSSAMFLYAISHMNTTAPAVDVQIATTGVWNRSLT